MIISSNNTMRFFNIFSDNKKRIGDTSEKISSGKRINKAADDAGGASISENFRAQIRGLSQAERNIQDGVSMLQVVDGALDEVTTSLHRMKEIAIQASNGTLTSSDGKVIDKEFQQLKNNIDDLSNNTEFNTIKVLNSNKSLSLQVRDNPYMEYKIDLYDESTNALGLNGVGVDSVLNSENAIKSVDDALKKVIADRASIGAHTNNLEHACNDIKNANYNLTASLSRIEDVDMALSMVKLLKTNIITQYNEMMFSASKQSAESVNAVLNRGLGI